MNCTKCGHASPAGTKFCGECGARLVSGCAACGAENPPANRFCGECGAPLATAAARRDSPGVVPPRHLAERILQSKQALEGERKQVTVLFADMKGSMELLADRDPEDARKLLDPVLERMMEAVHHYEGTVNQVMGDGIMALFGAPIAHEDHAVRACYAALRMQDSVRRYTEGLRTAHGIEVQIRVGLNSGEVVVRSIGSDLRMDYSAVGQTTHLAARMEQLATPGTIRLTGATLALAEGYVAVKSIGPVPVKGLAQPVEVFELSGAGTARTRLQVSRARGLTQFVGRDPEMEQLRRAAEQARGGHGQIIAVVGEPGVGKSRLYYEFLQSHHAREFLVLESGSVSYGKATPFLPLADLMRSYFRIDARDDVRGIRVKVTGGLLTLDESLKDAVPVALWLLDAIPEDSAFLALEPAERRRQTFEAVKRILMREIEQRPLVLVFEDLHWIDGETQAFLDGFIESVPAARLLLAVNYRPEYRHNWQNKTYYRQVRVDPLPPESAEDLLAGLLGSDASLTPLKSLLIERTEGRPLFLEESVRTLIETGALVGERGACRLVRAVDALQVPATVQAILASRIDRLAPEDKRLLQAAAVVGTHVPFAVLKAIAEIGEDELRQGLARLQTAEFMYEARLFPELEYAFKHALTHEVAYGSVLQERRQSMHRALVDAIERIYAGRLAEQIERLAHHALAGRVLPDAVRYLKQAGSRALGRSANQEAVAYFEQALALQSEMPQSTATLGEELEIRMGLGAALITVKGPQSQEVEGQYQRALWLVDHLKADASRFPVLWGLWYVSFTRAQHAAAFEAAQRLLETVRGGDDPGLLLEAHHALWPTLTAMGRPMQALIHAEQGLALYNPERDAAQRFVYGGHDPGACCRFHLAMIRWLTGRPDRALRDLRDALRLSEELGHPMTTVLSSYSAAWVHYQRGELEPAVSLFGQVASLAKRYGIPRYGAHAEVLVRCAEGPRLGIDAMDALRELVFSNPWPSWQKIFSVCVLARNYADSGHVERALQILRAVAGDSAGTCIAPEIPRLEGELLAKLDTPELVLAEERMREAVTLADKQGSKSLQLRATTSLARLLLDIGRRDEARAALTGIYGWFTEGFDTSDLKSARAVLDGLQAPA
ncbi:MAG: AAA family ATPase [Betaproteobacteria bacterium]|nr:AAA family ATPase [Betaproteobacteria bacterium]